MDECGTKPKEEEVLDVGLAGFHNRHSVLRTVLESDSSTTMATALPRLMKEEQSVWGQHEEVATFVGGGREERFEGEAWGGEDNSLCSVFFNASLLHREEGEGQEWGEAEGEE